MIRDVPYWVLIGLVVFALFMVAMNKAARADEAQIRSDCTRDALRYCKASIPAGRNAIIACMLNNRDKLQPKCSRHLY